MAIGYLVAKKKQQKNEDSCSVRRAEDSNNKQKTENETFFLFLSFSWAFADAERNLEQTIQETVYKSKGVKRKIK